MKTVLAAFIAVLAASAVPAAAEPSLTLRGVSDAGGTATRIEAAAPVATAATTPVSVKKVRVVLASPYRG